MDHLFRSVANEVNDLRCLVSGELFNIVHLMGDSRIIHESTGSSLDLFVTSSTGARSEHVSDANSDEQNNLASHHFSVSRGPICSEPSLA